MWRSRRIYAAFEEVKTHFEHLFVRLFGSGRAYIQLTEEDDPLDAGLSHGEPARGKASGHVASVRWRDKR